MPKNIYGKSIIKKILLKMSNDYIPVISKHILMYKDCIHLWVNLTTGSPMLCQYKRIIACGYKPPEASVILLSLSPVCLLLNDCNLY